SGGARAGAGAGAARPRGARRGDRRRRGVPGLRRRLVRHRCGVDGRRRADRGMSVVAATKLEIPPHREGLVPRAALVSLRAGAEHTRVTMLAAPAGSGKTTLLQQWHLAAPASQPFAWLSLEPSDDDPVRFWSCVIEALRMVAPGVGARAEGALHS